MDIAVPIITWVQIATYRGRISPAASLRRIRLKLVERRFCSSQNGLGGCLFLAPLWNPIRFGRSNKTPIFYQRILEIKTRPGELRHKAAIALRTTLNLCPGASSTDSPAPAALTIPSLLPLLRKTNRPNQTIKPISLYFIYIYRIIREMKAGE